MNKNTRIDKVYLRNLEILNSIVGLKIVSAIEEKYYYEGVLDIESRGDLKLKFDDGKEFIFTCDGDANSLNIETGIFQNRKLEADFIDGRYKWELAECFNPRFLNRLGAINSAYIEISNWYDSPSQTGCKLIFENGDYLRIWTIESDNIFYGINEEPFYPDEVKEKFELRSVNNNLEREIYSDVTQYYFQKLFPLVFGVIFLVSSTFGIIYPELTTLRHNGELVEPNFMNMLPFTTVGILSLILFNWLNKNYFRIKMTNEGVKILNGMKNVSFKWQDIEIISGSKFPFMDDLIFKVITKNGKIFYFLADKPSSLFVNNYNKNGRTEMSKLVNELKVNKNN